MLGCLLAWGLEGARGTYIYIMYYIYGPRLRRIRRVSRIRTQNISPQPRQNISSNFMAELGEVLKKLIEAIEKQTVQQAAHQEQMLKHLEALSLQQKKTIEFLHKHLRASQHHGDEDDENREYVRRA